jgi:hypothetical protein
MENKLITIDELEVGDEILISCQSHFKYLKVLKQPVIGKRIHWNTKQPLYNRVKCSTKQERVTKSYNYGNTVWTREEIVWELTPDDHNFTQNYELEERQLFLIKKGKI